MIAKLTKAGCDLVQHFVFESCNSAGKDHEVYLDLCADAIQQVAEGCYNPSVAIPNGYRNDRVSYLQLRPYHFI